MRRLWAVLAVMAAILFTASPVAMTDAAIWEGAGKAAPTGQYSPIHPAACYGWGGHCPPGTIWRCGYYGRCWCAPCW